MLRNPLYFFLCFQLHKWSKFVILLYIQCGVKTVIARHKSYPPPPPTKKGYCVSNNVFKAMLLICIPYTLPTIDQYNNLGYRKIVFYQTSFNILATINVPLSHNFIAIHILCILGTGTSKYYPLKGQCHEIKESYTGIQVIDLKSLEQPQPYFSIFKSKLTRFTFKMGLQRFRR